MNRKVYAITGISLLLLAKIALQDFLKGTD
jgi:hypothetical protein